MAFVHLCRHGQDCDNAEGLLNGHRDRPLTSLGVEQAHTATAKIASSGVNYTIIYSSPLQRARLTADIISQTISCPVETLDNLIERDFGVLAGKPYSNICEYSHNNTLQGDRVLYFLEAEGAESFDETYKRAEAVLSFVDSKHVNEHVLLVCHGDIGKMIQAARMHINWRDALLLPLFANTDVIDLEYC